MLLWDAITMAEADGWVLLHGPSLPRQAACYGRYWLRHGDGRIARVSWPNSSVEVWPGDAPDLDLSGVPTYRDVATAAWAAGPPDTLDEYRRRHLAVYGYDAVTEGHHDDCGGREVSLTLADLSRWGVPAVTVADAVRWGAPPVRGRPSSARSIVIREILGDPEPAGFAEASPYDWL